MRWIKSAVCKVRVSLSTIRSMASLIPINLIDAENVAVKYLKSGCVIAVPTDTVYGIACDASRVNAINNLYGIKCRNENKPVAICLGEVYDVKTWAVVHHLPEGLLEALLPGPVTLVLNCANKLDKSLSFNGKVGIRVPNYEFIRNLARGLEKPLALTSANISNQPSAVQVSEFSTIWEKLAGVFDGGHLGSNHSASTVVDLSEPGQFKIIRQGIAYSETINILKQFGLLSFV